MTEDTTEPTLEPVSVEEVPEPPAKNAPPPEMVTLYMKRTRAEAEGWEDPNANLKYGPAPANTNEALTENIHFYNRYATCRADHPLLDSLLTKYPVEIVTTEEKAKLYVDADTGKEYKSKKAYQAAQRAKKAAKKG